MLRIKDASFAMQAVSMERIIYVIQSTLVLGCQGLKVPQALTNPLIYK